jgi:NADPH-dependent 2,4-dienoyl-CoA reductase/sulfur reductase-like enzyme
MVTTEANTNGEDMNGNATNGGTLTNGSAVMNGTNTGVGPDGIATPKSSGIKVIIVGLGYAGCVAAIECHRKGHEVIVYEQAPQITNIGTSPSHFLNYIPST